MMGFLLQTVSGGHVPAFEYHPASAFQPQVGMVLKLDGGLLVKSGASEVPEFVAMKRADAALTEGEMIPVVRVMPEIEFGVPASADMAAVPVGSKVTIHADGLRVTATTGGPAKITGREGTAEGDIQWVRFEAAE